MKHIILILMFIISVTTNLYADEDLISASAGEEYETTSSWLDFAPFPNGQLSLVFDISVGQPGALGTLSLIKSEKLALDIRVGHLAMVNTNNIWIIGLGVNIDEIDWISQPFKNTFNSIGLWAGRDWDRGIWRGGVYATIFTMNTKGEDE